MTSIYREFMSLSEKDKARDNLKRSYPVVIDDAEY